MLSKMKFLVVVVAAAVCCLMTSTAQAETELTMYYPCLLYTSDAADECPAV